jgi:hypothetical protein
MNGWYLFVIAAVITSLLYFRPWKYIGWKHKTFEWEWRKKHPYWAWIWTVIIVLLCLIFFPEIVAMGKWIALAAIAGPSQTIGGPDRSEWGIIRRPQPLEDQGKSVGPLLWNHAAIVEMRPGVKRERVDENGICFVGVMLPATWADKKFATFHAKSSWAAYLVDYTTTNRFLEKTFLGTHGTTKKDVPVGIFRLSHLASAACEETVYPRNDTGKSLSRPPAVVEQYLQAIGDRPDEIVIETMRESPGISEYLVEVGVEETTLTVPRKLQWACIAPIHHTAYQSSLDGAPVPAEGISLGERKNYQAVIATVNGKRRVLDKALLLKPEEEGPSHITLALNIAEVDRPTMGVVTPAKIIVVVKTR